MFEKHHQEVISNRQFAGRQLRYILYTLLIMTFSLSIGVAGYMITADLSFEDALLNASMILTGMGPVNTMTTSASKYFASFYALYSGVAFLTMMGVFLAPGLHRLLHKMHLQQ